MDRQTKRVRLAVICAMISILLISQAVIEAVTDSPGCYGLNHCPIGEGYVPALFPIVLCWFPLTLAGILVNQFLTKQRHERIRNQTKNMP